MLQLGVDPLILRVCYLMQNFHLPFIQGRHLTEEWSDEGPDAKRLCPSRAEIRWYGGSDDGLVDVRGNVSMWGTNREIKRFEDLRSLDEHKDKSDIDIGEMVLEENLIALDAEEHRKFIESMTPRKM